MPRFRDGGYGDHPRFVPTLRTGCRMKTRHPKSGLSDCGGFHGLACDDGARKPVIPRRTEPARGCSASLLVCGAGEEWNGLPESIMKNATWLRGQAGAQDSPRGHAQERRSPEHFAQGRRKAIPRTDAVLTGANLPLRRVFSNRSNVALAKRQSFCYNPKMRQSILKGVMQT